MVITHRQAYDEIAEFIAAMNPRKLVAFRPSEAFQQRVETLLEKNRDGSISTEERGELEHFLLLDHMISLAKIRAQKMLAQPAFA